MTILTRALATLATITVISIFSSAHGAQASRPELFGSWKVINQPEHWLSNYVFFSRSKFLVAENREYTYELDASQTPKHIDLQTRNWDGKIGRYTGIYRLRGDAITICLQSADPISGILPSRPLDFALGGERGPFLIDLVRVDMEKGELELYPGASQNGTVASRTFRDQEGRSLKVIYYGDGAKHELNKVYLVRPAREDELVVREIRINKYNEDGLLAKEEIYDPAMKLTHILSVEYDAERHRTRSWWSDAGGVKYYEMRHAHEPGGDITVGHIYFDGTGSYIIGMRGRIPKDVDLPHGWGEPVNDLVCGIVVSKERGAFSQIELSENIKNAGASLARLGPLPDAEMTLCDSSGKVIAEIAGYRSPGNSLPRIQDEIIGSGSVSYVYPSYPLRERYRPLATGRYTIQIRQPVPALGITLRSNKIAFFIE